MSEGGQRESYTVEEVAARTGIPESTIFKVIARKELPHFRATDESRKILVRRADLVEWMKFRVKRSVEEEA